MPIKRNNGLLKAVLGNVPLGAIYYGSNLVYGYDEEHRNRAIYNYSISNDEVTITGLRDSTKTILNIPATIEGYPVKTIAEYAFKGNIGLTNISIPASVTSIGSGAFRNCSGLKVFSVDNSNANFASQDGILYDKAKTYIYAVPASIECEVVIPNGVRSVVDNLSYGGDFSSCCNLIGITIPASVNYISYSDNSGSIFRSCKSLRHIIVDSANTTYHSVNDNCLIKTSDKKIIAVGTNFNVIPADGSVTSIGYGAFWGRSGLTSITIPDSVTSIGDYAFNLCSVLTNISIPDSVIAIGQNAFNGTAWYNNQPDGVVYAGKVAYQYKGVMPSESAITLSADTKAIADYAFAYRSALWSIMLPENIIYIGRRAFAECDLLQTITIPASVTSIADYAFYKCTNLAVIFADNCQVSSLGDNVFAECCYGLITITIPASVKSIGGYAFYKCTYLKTVICNPTTPPTLGSSIAFDTKTGFRIKVPSASVNAYKAATNWSSYSNYIEAIA